MKKYILLLIAISITIHANWFFSGDILNAGDWLFLHDSFSKGMIANQGAWISHLELGTFPILLVNLPFYYLISFATILGFSYDLATRFIFLIPIAIFAPIGMFLLIKKLTNNYFASFISAIFYSFNTFFLRLQLDWLTFAFVWAITPFIYLLYIKLYEYPTIKNSIYLAIISTISIVYEPRVSIIVFAILSIDFLFRSFLNKSISIGKIRSFMIFGVLLILLNSFWILLGIAPLEGVAYEPPSKYLFANYYNILNAFSVQHYTWCEHTVCVPFKNNFPLPELLIFPLLAFSALILNKTKKNDMRSILSFSFIALIGIFLSKQQGPPFGIIYEWSFYNVPLFNLYRESSKFFIISGLALSILAAYSLTAILSIFKNKKMVYAIVIVLILFMFGYNWFNVATGQVGGMFKPKTINQDYYTIEAKTIKDNYYRTLWVPRMNRFSYFDFNKPAISLVTEIQSSWIPFSTFRSIEYSWSGGKQTLPILSNNFSKFLLDSSSVRYVLIPSDDGIYKNYGPREYFEDSISKLQYLEQRDFNLSNVTIYENKGYYPHIYTPDVYYITTLDNFNKMTNDYDGANISIRFDSNNVLIDNSSAYIPYYYSSNHSFRFYKISDDVKKTILDLKNYTKIGDCNRYDNRTLNETKISAKYENDTIEMTALYHIGCIYFPIKKINGVYKLKISFRTISGQPARFAIWQIPVKKTINFDTERDENWQRKEFVFEIDTNTTALSLVLYSDGDRKNLTRVQYRDIQIDEIKLNRSYSQITTELNHNLIQETKKLRKQMIDDKKIAFLFSTNKIIEQNNKYFYNISSPFGGERPIETKIKNIEKMNITFNDNTTVGDCNRYDNRSYDELKLSREIIDNKSIKLTALDHIACVYTNLNHSNALYLMNITYKGNNPSFSIYQPDVGTPYKFPVRKTNEWRTEQYQFTLNRLTKKASLGLFAQGDGKELIENYYSNISITKLTLDEPLEIKFTQKVPEIEFEQIIPTKYVVNVKNASENFILVFGDAYHPEWKSFVKEKGKTVNWLEAFSSKSEEHFIANGWSNGFAIENCKGECTITLYFLPQSYYYLGLLVTIATLLFSMLYLIYAWYKNRKKEDEITGAKKGMFKCLE